MPIISELYGRTLTTSGAYSADADILQARCPHMDNRLCDGGGNRDMMRWPAKREPLASLFDSSVGREGGGFIPCGPPFVMQYCMQLASLRSGVTHPVSTRGRYGHVWRLK